MAGWPLKRLSRCERDRWGEEREHWPFPRPRLLEKAVEAVILLYMHRADYRWETSPQMRPRWNGGGVGSANLTAAAMVTFFDTAAQDPVGGCGTIVGSVAADKVAATTAGGRRHRGHATVWGTMP